MDVICFVPVLHGDKYIAIGFGLKADPSLMTSSDVITRLSMDLTGSQGSV